MTHEEGNVEEPPTSRCFLESEDGQVGCLLGCSAEVWRNSSLWSSFMRLSTSRIAFTGIQSSQSQSTVDKSAIRSYPAAETSKLGP